MRRGCSWMWMFCLVTAVSTIAARPASASQIIQLHGFSGSSFGSILVDPFDEALGTLDSIHVGITGTLVVTGITGQLLVPTGGTPAPVPYTYQVDVSQEFHGLGNRYFHFNGPAQFVLPGVATGAGEGMALVATYSYGFTLNAFTDLAGFTIPATSSSIGALVPPLSGVSGQRSAFLDGLFPLDQIDFFQFATVQTFGVPLLTPFVIANTSTSGLLELQYNYTPAPVAAPVPEPATLGLVGAGLGWLVRRRLRA